MWLTANFEGRISSSGTTIHGHETKFMNELRPGDAIIITHPTTFSDESKIVRMVLSNISISISSAFSSDLISTTPFRFIKSPEELPSIVTTENEVDKQKRKRVESEDAAYGTYASNGM